MKWVAMMDIVIHEEVYGKVAGYVSVVEFQKRGLPHTHTVLFL